MDELEYDIYDDLDVFKGNEKQEKEVSFSFCLVFLLDFFGATSLAQSTLIVCNLHFHFHF